MNAPCPSPPFPLNPSVGERFGSWVWNGVRWVLSPASGIQVIIRFFTASGPYFPSAGLVTAVAECWGPGGMGGSLTIPFAGAWGAGSGGGSGGYSRKACPAALVAGGVVVTIGAGGAVNSVPGQMATFAGPTSFGALCVANGGGNAWPFLPTTTPNAYYSPHGYGAPGGVGDFVAAGMPGIAWSTVVIPESGGGQTVYALEGMGGAILGGSQGMNFELGSSDGFNGRGNTGAGGGGAVSNGEAAGTFRPGGVGADGGCVVTEYCWADGIDPCFDPCAGDARVTQTRDFPGAGLSGWPQDGSAGFLGDPSAYIGGR